MADDEKVVGNFLNLGLQIHKWRSVTENDSHSHIYCWELNEANTQVSIEVMSYVSDNLAFFVIFMELVWNNGFQPFGLMTF